MTPIGEVLVVGLTILAVAWMFWQMWRDDARQNQTEK